jgi:hypothetical protein
MEKLLMKGEGRWKKMNQPGGKALKDYRQFLATAGGF